jgi:hypothetical protein
MKCDVCGRKMKVHSPGRESQYILRCDHKGRCKGHPEGEACQYYYLWGNVVCVLRLTKRLPSQHQIREALPS